ncbi:hypothetical protein LXA43DRAFT_628877 [Ganoderma leucocontextum]|nr:hypothetical protein LXA43DRAFT_628877 [Ganoderma leucocontextum]
MRTVNRHGLLRHAALFDKLEPCHMSGDEAAVAKEGAGTGSAGQAYHIVEAAWQSREFKICMRDLDVWNIQDFGVDRPSGSRPRWRVALETPRVVNSTAPAGLWRNCYDPHWLKKLDAPRRRLLRIIDQDFDFTLPKYKERIIVNAANEFPTYEEDEEGADGDVEGEDGEREDE